METEILNATTNGFRHLNFIDREIRIQFVNEVLANGGYNSEILFADGAFRSRRSEYMMLHHVNAMFVGDENLAGEMVDFVNSVLTDRLYKKRLVFQDGSFRLIALPRPPPVVVVPNVVAVDGGGVAVDGGGVAVEEVVVVPNVVAVDGGGVPVEGGGVAVDGGGVAEEVVVVSNAVVVGGDDVAVDGGGSPVEAVGPVTRYENFKMRISVCSAIAKALEGSSSENPMSISTLKPLVEETLANGGMALDLFPNFCSADVVDALAIAVGTVDPTEKGSIATVSVSGEKLYYIS